MFPNESYAYRAERNKLLEAEIEHRRATEALAKARRALPNGGKVKEDYVFEGENGPIKFSDLFVEGQESLVLYSFMYNPNEPRPCPACTSCMDAVDGNVPHITQRVPFYLVSKSPYPRFKALGEERGWCFHNLLSSSTNSYSVDYFGEREDGNQMPMLNIFRKTDEGIFHFWGSEMLFSKSDPGQDNRHIDMLWPLWNMLDLLPEGRGDFFPNVLGD